MTLPFCFFSLGQLVNWLIQVQILLQFIWQCAAVMLLRRYRPDIPKPFRMWLYPLPALISLGMWLYIFVSSPLPGIVFSTSGVTCRKCRTCSSEQNPMTRSTPARLYQLRSKITTSPAAGTCGK